MSARPAARNPDFAAGCRGIFDNQSLMATLGASLETVEPGFIEIRFPRGAGNLQQNGFVHGGAIAAIADVAGGIAAYSLMPVGVGVLTVEFKINFLAPATQEVFVARGRVEKSGRTLMVVRVDVVGLDGDREIPVAILSGTMMATEPRAG